MIKNKALYFFLFVFCIPMGAMHQKRAKQTIVVKFEDIPAQALRDTCLMYKTIHRFGDKVITDAAAYFLKKATAEYLSHLKAQKKDSTIELLVDTALDLRLAYNCLADSSGTASRNESSLEKKRQLIAFLENLEKEDYRSDASRYQLLSKLFEDAKELLDRLPVMIAQLNADKQSHVLMFSNLYIAEAKWKDERDKKREAIEQKLAKDKRLKEKAAKKRCRAAQAVSPENASVTPAANDNKDPQVQKATDLPKRKIVKVRRKVTSVPAETKTDKTATAAIADSSSNDKDTHATTAASASSAIDAHAQLSPKKQMSALEYAAEKNEYDEVKNTYDMYCFISEHGDNLMKKIQPYYIQMCIKHYLRTLKELTGLTIAEFFTKQLNGICHDIQQRSTMLLKQMMLKYYADDTGGSKDTTHIIALLEKLEREFNDSVPAYYSWIIPHFFEIEKIYKLIQCDQTKLANNNYAQLRNYCYQDIKFIAQYKNMKQASAKDAAYPDIAKIETRAQKIIRAANNTSLDLNKRIERLNKITQHREKRELDKIKSEIEREEREQRKLAAKAKQDEEALAEKQRKEKAKEKQTRQQKRKEKREKEAKEQEEKLALENKLREDQEKEDLLHQKLKQVLKKHEKDALKEAEKDAHKDEWHARKEEYTRKQLEKDAEELAKKKEQAQEEALKQQRKAEEKAKREREKQAKKEARELKRKQQLEQKAKIKEDQRLQKEIECLRLNDINVYVQPLKKESDNKGSTSMPTLVTTALVQTTDDQKKDTPASVAKTPEPTVAVENKSRTDIADNATIVLMQNDPTPISTIVLAEKSDNSKDASATATHPTETQPSIKAEMQPVVADVPKASLTQDIRSATIQHALAAEGNINAPKFNETLPIFHAIKEGNVTALQAILRDSQQRKTLNSWNAAGYTPLNYACLHGNEQMVSMLLQAGAKPDKYSSHETFRPLHYALFGNRPFVSLLIAHKAFVNKRQSDICSPLEAAVTTGNQANVRLLLDFKAVVTDAAIAHANHQAKESEKNKNQATADRKLIVDLLKERVRMPLGLRREYRDAAPMNTRGNTSNDPKFQRGRHMQRQARASHRARGSFAGQGTQQPSTNPVTVPQYAANTALQQIGQAHMQGAQPSLYAPVINQYITVVYPQQQFSSVTNYQHMPVQQQFQAAMPQVTPYQMFGGQSAPVPMPSAMPYMAQPTIQQQAPVITEAMKTQKWTEFIDASTKGDDNDLKKVMEIIPKYILPGERSRGLQKTPLEMAIFHQTTMPGHGKSTIVHYLDFVEKYIARQAAAYQNQVGVTSSAAAGGSTSGNQPPKVQ